MSTFTTIEIHMVMKSTTTEHHRAQGHQFEDPALEIHMQGALNTEKVLKASMWGIMKNQGVSVCECINIVNLQTLKV